MILLLADSFNFIAFLNIAFTGICFGCLILIVISHSSLLMYRKLRKYLKLQNEKLISKKFFTQMQLARKLLVFRCEHYRITSMLIFVNSNFINCFLLSTFLISFPYNIIVSSLMIVDKIPEISNEFIRLSMIAQSISMMTLMLLIASCNSSIYSCQKYLVSLQCGLGRNQLRDKIHHLRFYELVHYKQDIGFTVGLFGVLTKRKLYEVCSTFG